jgi:hypothetical protein
MRRAVTVLIVSSGLMLTSLGAGEAHPTRDFDACTQTRRLCIDRGAAFDYGSLVIVKGHVRPAHSHQDAVVLRKRPHASVWRRVDTVGISDGGRMRYRWRTDHGDAVQDAPYLFRFRIRGHGVSNGTEAYVLFGE